MNVPVTQIFLMELANVIIKKKRVNVTLHPSLNILSNVMVGRKHLQRNFGIIYKEKNNLCFFFLTQINVLEAPNGSVIF